MGANPYDEDHPLHEPWQAVLDALPNRSSPSSSDVFDELDRKAASLVQKGRFQNKSDAQTHLLEHDSDMRRKYLEGTGGSDRTRTIKGNDGQRELLQKAERKVAAGEADSLADAMTGILENNPELARRAGYRV